MPNTEFYSKWTKGVEKYEKKYIYALNKLSPPLHQFSRNS